MKYTIKFPTRNHEKAFERILLATPHINVQNKIMKEVERLANDPRPFKEKKFKKLALPINIYKFTARYRIRIGNHRVLYGVDDKRKTVWILALRKRNEKTY